MVQTSGANLDLWENHLIFETPQNQCSFLRKPGIQGHLGPNGRGRTHGVLLGTDHFLLKFILFGGLPHSPEYVHWGKVEDLERKMPFETGSFT